MLLNPPADSRQLALKLPKQKQEIVIGSGILDWSLTEIVARQYQNVLLLVDKNLPSHHLQNFTKIKEALHPNQIILVEPNESSKSLDFLNHVMKKLYRNPIGRKGVIVSFGGGIVGDLGGFLSSVYMRGIDNIFIPSTLMAQGDTVIQKVALSYRLLKNIVGSFHSPVLTVCDVQFLQSLPNQEICFGLSEVIKHALIASKKDFEWLEKIFRPGLSGWSRYPWTEIVFRSLRVKAALVTADPLDSKGHQVGLSYGHTVANAIESLMGFRLKHGQAVSLGMVYAAHLATRLGRLSKQAAAMQMEMLKRIGLPTRLRAKIDPEAFINLMEHDKIATESSINIVILKKIGAFMVARGLDHAIIRKSLASIQGR